MMIDLPLDLDPNFVNVDIDDYRLFQDGSVKYRKAGILRKGKY